MSGVEDMPVAAARTTEVAAVPTLPVPEDRAETIPHISQSDLSTEWIPTEWIPTGWTRSSNGFLVPAQLAEDLEKESPLSHLLAEKIRQTPSWAATLDKWATAATRATNILVKVAESVAPLVERTSHLIAQVAASPRTVEALVILAGLLVWAEKVEAEGGDLDAFVLGTARMRLGQANVSPDSLLRNKLQQLVVQHGGEFELRYLMDLIDHHRRRLVRNAESGRIDETTLVVRRGIKRFASVDKALEALALQGQSREDVLEKMIPGFAYAERAVLSQGGNLAGKVASQIRREGVERPDDPSKVVTMAPEQLVSYADELELTAFAERELVLNAM